MSARWNFQLSKSYQTAERQFEINLQCKTNAESLVLFGPSGAGKTQVLKMLAGLVKPDSGYIQFNGKELFNSATGYSLSPQERSLAYVFQEYALFPHLTVLQNIAFSLSKTWFAKRQHEHHPLVQEWLEKMDLQQVGHQYPHQLSGGQSQRVALARALVSQPQALLLDEPFASLDEGLKKNLRQELRTLQKQLAIPMILITHSQADVDALADEVIHLSHGSVASTLE
ncbi:MAG: ABC transporter ATP-binding protein [Polynucleobacter sp.]|nr:MAG: ABC transporter ATP-binding protein [Polynucleobacter sp.]